MSCPVNRYKGSNYTKPETQSPESKAFHDEVQKRLAERALQDAKLFPALHAAPAAPSAPRVNHPGAKDSTSNK